MIVFVGQVGSDMVDREAFQEIDYRRMYGSVAKWAAQIDRAERIPEYVAHAYPHRDVGAARARRARAARGHADGARRCAPMRRTSTPIAAAPSPDDVARASRRCCAMRSGRWSSSAAAAGTPTRATRCVRFAEASRTAGRVRVPPPGSLRQSPSALRGRRRHRHQSEARGARARRRRAARHRRAPRRNDDVRLYAARRAGAARRR